MNLAPIRLGSKIGALFVGALTLLPATPAAAPDLQRGKGGAGVQRPRGEPTGSSRLKHLSTTRTTIEIWLPIVGWTVVSETTRVTCGPGGENCPFNPEA